jgi:hypothetical protein
VQKGLRASGALKPYAEPAKVIRIDSGLRIRIRSGRSSTWSRRGRDCSGWSLEGMQ